MKRFLKNVLIFSAMVLVLLVVGEVVSRRLPSSYALKARYMQDNASDIRVLVLGLSHTYYGIRPDVLGEGTFNLANITQTPEYDLALLRQYIDSMPGLRYVILPVSYCTYRDESVEDSQIWTLGIRYKVEMDLPLHSDFSRYNLMLCDFDTYRGKLANLVVDRPSNICDSLGFGLGYDISHRSPDWEDGGKWHADRHTLPYMGRDSVVLACQAEIIGLCRSHGVEPVFVTTPCWVTYRRNLDPVQLDEMRRAIDLLTRDFGVRYYDFLDDWRFVDEDFHDVDHLSDLGAAKLTKILKDTIGL